MIFAKGFHDFLFIESLLLGSRFAFSTKYEIFRLKKETLVWSEAAEAEGLRVTCKNEKKSAQTEKSAADWMKLLILNGFSQSQLSVNNKVLQQLFTF